MEDFTNYAKKKKHLEMPAEPQQVAHTHALPLLRMAAFQGLCPSLFKISLFPGLQTEHTKLPMMLSIWPGARSALRIEKQDVLQRQKHLVVARILSGIILTLETREHN